MTDTEDFLEHYGIKGMKWGVRRKRGSDGRVVGGKSKITKKEAKIRAKRQKMSNNRRQLSDDDVKKAVERLQNEKKLKQLVDEDLSPGKTIAKKVLSESGQTAARAVITGVGVYAVRAALERKFDPMEASKHLKPKK